MLLIGCLPPDNVNRPYDLSEWFTTPSAPALKHPVRSPYKSATFPLFQLAGIVTASTPLPRGPLLEYYYGRKDIQSTDRQ